MANILYTCMDKIICRGETTNSSCKNKSILKLERVTNHFESKSIRFARLDFWCSLMSFYRFFLFCFRGKKIYTDTSTSDGTLSHAGINTVPYIARSEISDLVVALVYFNQQNPFSLSGLYTDANKANSLCYKILSLLLCKMILRHLLSDCVENM